MSSQVQVVPLKVHRPHRSTACDLRFRIVSIEAGRSVAVPEYRTILTVGSIRFGCFSSDRQAIVFATSGRVLCDPIPLSVLFAQQENHTGFLGFDLSEAQIRHLLGTHRLMFGSSEITLYTDAVDLDTEEPRVVETKPITEGRRFR